MHGGIGFVPNQMLIYIECITSSVESQKGADVKRCSVENKKGAVAVQSNSLVIAPFWFSNEHR